MHDIKQILAIAVREARTELGLSQEKLAETLNMDTRMFGIHLHHKKLRI